MDLADFTSLEEDDSQPEYADRIEPAVEERAQEVGVGDDGVLRQCIREPEDLEVGQNAVADPVEDPRYVLTGCRQVRQRNGGHVDDGHQVVALSHGTQINRFQRLIWE